MTHDELKAYYDNQRQPTTIAQKQMAEIDASRMHILLELASIGIVGTIGLMVVLCILGS